MPAQGFNLGDPANKLLLKGFSSPNRMKVGQVETLPMRNAQGQVLDVDASRLSGTQVQLGIALVKY